MATVSGYVEKIKYRNEENGYSILSVNSDGLDYVLVGTFPYISEGDFIEASVMWSIPFTETRSRWNRMS